MTATQILTNKLAFKMLRGFLCITETMCKWQRNSEQKQCVKGSVLTQKKASNAVSNCQICKCSFSTKIGTGKSGRIATEKKSQTSNREGSRADH
jgi:hypothetical protein